MFEYIQEDFSLRNLSNAVLPWNSVDAEAAETRMHRKTSRVALSNEFTNDTQEQIDKCLSCQKLFCTDCPTNEYKRQYRAAKRLTIKHEYLEVQM